MAKPNLHRTQTGQMVFAEDYSDLDINKIELKPATDESPDLIRQFHGYVPTTVYVGRQLNYSIWCEGVEIGFFGWGSAVMAMSPRDEFIGWSKQQRVFNLIHCATNWRFTLINDLPKNTASKVVAVAIRRGRIDWKKKYGDELVLLETLVEPPRKGTLYLASDWKMVGWTKGTQYEWVDETDVTADMQVVKKHDTIIKDKVKVITGEASPKMIFIKTINKRWKKTLCKMPKCPKCIDYIKVVELGAKYKPLTPCVGCVNELIMRKIDYRLRNKISIEDLINEPKHSEDART